jgi:hypothetical protein
MVVDIISPNSARLYGPCLVDKASIEDGTVDPSQLTKDLVPSTEMKRSEGEVSITWVKSISDTSDKSKIMLLTLV